jgi:hypothetical protein
VDRPFGGVGDTAGGAAARLPDVPFERVVHRNHRGVLRFAVEGRQPGGFAENLGRQALQAGDVPDHHVSAGDRAGVEPEVAGAGAAGRQVVVGGGVLAEEPLPVPDREPL